MEQLGTGGPVVVGLLLLTLGSGFRPVQVLSRPAAQLLCRAPVWCGRRQCTGGSRHGKPTL